MSRRTYAETVDDITRMLLYQCAGRFNCLTSMVSEPGLCQRVAEEHDLAGLEVQFTKQRGFHVQLKKFEGGELPEILEQVKA